MKIKAWVKIALAFGMCLFLVNSASAAQYILGVDGSNWTNPAVWTTPGNGTLPGIADTAYIRGDRTVTIDSDVGSIFNFYIGDSASFGQTGTVNITGGKLVSVNGSTTVRSAVGRPLNGAMGYLNLSGGTLQMGAASGTNVLHIGVDTATTNHTTGIFSISGTGNFNGRLLVGSAISGDSGDKVRILGSSATIGTTSTSGNALEVRASGILEFIFDATGISTMDYGASQVGGTASFATGSQILIDGAAYTGGSNTFTLIRAGVLSAATTPTIVLTNFAEGTTYSYNTTLDTLTVTTAAIPEPATIGMVGLGAIALMIFRRQMRK